MRFGTCGEGQLEIYRWHCVSNDYQVLVNLWVDLSVNRG